MVLCRKQLQIVNVFLREHWDVNLDSGEIAVLPLSQALAVHHSAPELSGTQDLIDLNGEGSICQEDLVSRLDAGAQLVVAQADSGLLLVLVALPDCISGPDRLDDDSLSRYEVNGLVVSEHGSADLRALGVQQSAPVGDSRKLLFCLKLFTLGLGHLIP